MDKKRDLSRWWLNTLYRDVRIGDLIVVPSPTFLPHSLVNWVNTHTLIGEIVEIPRVMDHDLPEHILAANYVVRRVSWLSTVNELELPKSIAASLRTQNALISFPTTSCRSAIGAAYNNIVIDEDFYARFATERSDFSAFECFHFTAFAMAVVAAYRSAAIGDDSIPDSASIYEMAASVERSAEFVPVQDASIHSPGHTTLYGGMIVPAVIAALFALALEGKADPFSDSAGGEVNVVNSQSGRFDPCEVGIDDSVREILDIMGYERWKQLCEAAVKSNESGGLRPEMGIDVIDGKDGG